MVEYSDFIKERTINQGNLVFIIHNEKPVKSGWWRKVKNKEEVIYILEKPVHKEFSLEHKDVRESRVEHEVCVMKDSTLSYGQDVNNKFEILASASGLAQYIIMNNNYLQNVNTDTWDKLMRENIIVTDNFEKLFSLYTNEKQYSNIEELAKNMI